MGRRFFTKEGGVKRASLCLALVSVCMMVMGLNGCSHSDDSGAIFIALGDSYANGAQSGRVNHTTQIHGYPQVIADQMSAVIDMPWGNPLLDIEGRRLDAAQLPYNLGVSGATVQSLLTEKTGPGSDLNELMRPIPLESGDAVTQLEAAEYVSGLHSEKTLKIITLFIGGNDLLGAVIAGGGSELTEVQITAFLNDETKGHDLASVRRNLTTIVHRLTAIPNSHVFIATLPSVAAIAGLFSGDDIEKLATYTTPQVTALAPGESMGFGPLTGLGGLLASDDATLNAAIDGVLAAGGNDAFSLSASERALIDARTVAINDHIRQLATDHPRVHLVAMQGFFASVFDGGVVVQGTPISRSYGGGLFSLDGFHPSHTGYALIADEFIKAINGESLIREIPRVDLATIQAGDPYHDRDGDGYLPGPSDSTTIDPNFISFMDCDDTDASIAAPFPSLGMTGRCAGVAGP